MPDARAREAVHDRDPELLSGTGCVFHLLRRTAVNAGRIAIAPDVLGHNRLVPLVDWIEDGLANEVIADREDLQIVALEQIAFGRAISVVGQRLVHFKMIAPAS